MTRKRQYCEIQYVNPILPICRIKLSRSIPFLIWFTPTWIITVSGLSSLNVGVICGSGGSGNFVVPQFFLDMAQAYRFRNTVTEPCYLFNQFNGVAVTCRFRYYFCKCCLVFFCSLSVVVGVFLVDLVADSIIFVYLLFHNFDRFCCFLQFHHKFWEKIVPQLRTF